MKSLIKKLPPGVQLPFRYAFGTLPPSIRYGKNYRHTLSLLRESQRWSPNRLRHYQLQKLKELLVHCHKSVPYYQQIFAAMGFEPEEISSLSDIEELPLLTKNAIRDNADSLTSRALDREHLTPSTTGGSSGDPLSFYKQRYFSDARELAFISMLWERTGYRFGRDRRMVFTGTIPRNSSGIEYRPATKELICSTYKTSAQDFDYYYEELTSSGIEYIHGHVSSIVSFARHIMSKGNHYPLKAVLGSSEKVYDFQRDMIQRAFGARLFSWYGQTEQVALAGECEHSEKYHVFPEYGLLEIVDGNGRVINAAGVVGEIVATGFNNYAMPFVRYRTGDMAMYAAGLCDLCHRRYKLLENIEGRSYEYVIDKHGNRISLTGLIFGQHFNAFSKIIKMQIHQKEQGSIDIWIIPAADYETRLCEKEIRETIRRASGNGLSVSFSYVDQITNTEAGKHRFLIQEVEETHGPVS